MPQPITVRRMGFEFPDEIDPVFIPGDPEQSYTLIGLSLLLPYLEPYLIRTMKLAKQQISDPALIDALERFSAQEGQHYREHMRFNAALRRDGFPGLEPLERELDADYRRWSDERPLRFNLAYAEGFEALTTAAARFGFEEGGFGTGESPISKLIAWHAVEELEHRTVAFDVYDHLVGSYWYRLGVGTFAQWHLSRFVGRVAKYMIRADPEAIERAGGEAGMKERRRMRSGSVVRKLLPNVLRTYLPWYTPHRIPFTPAMQAASEQLTAMAKSAR